MYLASSGMLEQEPEPSASAARRRRRSSSTDPLWNPYHVDLGLDSPHEYFSSLLAMRRATSVTGAVSPAATNPDLDHFLRLATNQDPSCKGGSSAAAGQRSPRQRIEILSWPPAVGGETWDYRWRSYLDECTHATNHFFHMCVLSRTRLLAHGPLTWYLLALIGCRPCTGTLALAMSLRRTRRSIVCRSWTTIARVRTTFALHPTWKHTRARQFSMCAVSACKAVVDETG